MSQYLAYLIMVNGDIIILITEESNNLLPIKANYFQDALVQMLQ